MPKSLVLTVLISGLILVPVVCSYAADSLSVGGFTSVFFSMRDSLGSGGYSVTGASVYSGGTFLHGGDGYTISDGIVNASETVPETLEDAHAYPNPCNIKNNCRAVKFTKITISAELKIYTVSGELVWKKEKNNSDNSITWDLRNSRGSEVASGLYVYYVKTSNSSKKGKLIVIR